MILNFVTSYFCLGKKYLIYNLVGRNLKIKYRRSFLGFFWTILNPIAVATIYYFVFKVIIKLQVPHYPAFILSGVLPWAFFSQTLAEGMESIVGHGGLISKIPMPVQAFPFVGCITNFITLALAVPILIGVSYFTKVELGASLLALPVLLGILFFICYGFSLILALAFIFFRDLRHILGIGLQLWFYGTPVVYRESMIPAKYLWILTLNPIGQIFVGLHNILVEGIWPSNEVWIGASSWAVGATVVAYVTNLVVSKNAVEQI